MKIDKLIILLTLILPCIIPVSATAKGVNRSHDCVESQSHASSSTTNQTFIYYVTGHNGLAWSKITVDSSGPHLLTGSTGMHIDQSTITPIDTLNILKDNEKTIKWAIDSLATEIKQVEACIDTTYSPFNSHLLIVQNGDTICNYNLSRLKSFNGLNSKFFFTKLSRLGFLMYWLASPETRKVIPAIPNDTLVPDKKSIGKKRIINDDVTSYRQST